MDNEKIYLERVLLSHGPTKGPEVLIIERSWAVKVTDSMEIRKINYS